MQDLKPMIGYYIFLIFLFGLGLFLHYGLNYLKKKKENNQNK